MKTFQKFNEDIQALRRSLETIGRQDAPKQRFAARKERLHQISKSAGSEFNQRNAAEAEARTQR